MVDQLKSHIPLITEEQIKQFQLLIEVYPEINEMVNLISRKDIDKLFERHILHSIALHKYHTFKEGHKVVDIGTRGGFPGIPLAILNPQTQFVLVDSIGKKIKAVNELIHVLELKNTTAINDRVENLPIKFDMAIARAVSQSNKLFGWMKHKWVKKPHLLLLKGGDLTEEITLLRQSVIGKLNVQQFPLAKYFSDEFYESKKIVEITRLG